MSPAAPPPSRSDIAAVITEAIVRMVPGVQGGDVTGRAHLRDLGADSIDRVEIIVAVLDRLAVEVPLAAFGPLPDIDAMTDLLYERTRR